MIDQCFFPVIETLCWIFREEDEKGKEKKKEKEKRSIASSRSIRDSRARIYSVHVLKLAAEMLPAVVTTYEYAASRACMQNARV